MKCVKTENNSEMKKTKNFRIHVCLPCRMNQCCDMLRLCLYTLANHIESFFLFFLFQNRMRYVAAYLLAVLGGKESPSNADIEKILSSVGIEADGTKLSKVVADLKGKSIEDLIKEGREKLSSMPVGGGAAVAAAPAAGAEPAAEAKADKKGTFNVIYECYCYSCFFFCYCDEHNFNHLSHEFTLIRLYDLIQFTKKKRLSI